MVGAGGSVMFKVRWQNAEEQAEWAEVIKKKKKKKNYSYKNK